MKLSNLIPIVFLTIGFNSSAQEIWGLGLILKYKDNSAQTQAKIDYSMNSILKAYDAYIAGEIEKSKYFVDQAQKDGVKSGHFYYLLGNYMYHTEEFRAAKRYWKIAYKEGGCYDCKEYLEKLKNEEPLDDLLIARSKQYYTEIKGVN